jgi:hypothetical protein
MAFFRNLFGLAKGDQDAAQVRKQGKLVVERGVGHDGVL